ncbi:hypothetical protein DRH27_02875, partial [Candidatus Falkowbacteria bacterium]
LALLGLGLVGFGFLKKKSVIIPLIIIIAGVSAWAIFGKKEEQGSKEVQPKEWTVRSDDLTIAIESDGKVVAKDGVELSFSVSGDTLEVKEIFAQEGAKVKKGDKIASVITDDLQYDLNKAYASYQSALASYNEKVAGATDDEILKSLASIEQAEITLAQTKISLEKTKTSAKQKIKTAEDAVETAKDNLDDNRNELLSKDVNDTYDDLIDTIKAISITAQGVLPDSDEILGIDNKYINDVYENNIGVKDSSSFNLAKSTYNSSKNEKDLLDTYAIALSGLSSHTEVDTAAEQASILLNSLEEHLFYMQSTLEASITSVDLVQTKLDGFKSTINSNRGSVNTKITAINSDIQSVADVKEALDDYIEAYQDALNDLEDTKNEAQQDIANSESGLALKELSLEQVKRSHEELLAPLTTSELASARSSLTTASINVDKARNDLEKATLTSPIDGEVALLNYKTGDIILTDDTRPVVTIINNDTLFIEVNIEEAEINKIKVGQKAYTIFDALDGLKLEGEISFISLTSKTSNNGIVTYLVRVIITNTGEAQIREGMTAFVDFITAEAFNILIAPVNAVSNVGGKPSVRLVSGEWIEVITGFTDGSNVEIISGLNVGDKYFIKSEIK